MVRIFPVYRKQLFYIALGTMLIGLSACGSPSDARVPPSEPIPAPPVSDPTPVPTPAPASDNVTTIDLVAKNLSFNMSTITVPAGAGVTINFTNKDSVTHNFAVYENLAGGQTKPIFIGSNVASQGSTVYRFTTPAIDGSYFFECDIHPQFMNGPFVVTSP